MWHHQAVPGRSRSFARGGWRDGEVWLEDEIDWFSSHQGSAASAVPSRPLLGGSGGVALPPAWVASPWARRDPRHGYAGEPERLPERRRLAAWLVAAAVLAVVAASAALLLPRVAEFRGGTPRPATVPATAQTGVPGVRWEATAAQTPAAVAAFESLYPDIHWRRSTSVGLPHAGRLVDGVQLPIEGWDWVTWDPERNRVPNRANRLYGTDALVRTVLGVIGDYRRAFPGAPRVVVGDLSLLGGGEIAEHASHENGLDVDVYYPRRDGVLAAPTRVDQVDLALAQELVDRFVAAGATLVLVGYFTPLDGPPGTVIAYPNHDNHMHVRIAPPAGSR